MAIFKSYVTNYQRVTAKTINNLKLGALTVDICGKGDHVPLEAILIMGISWEY
jgi:hypothetical protein